MDKDFSTTPYVLKNEKPWGYELILTPQSSPVTGKLAFTKAGCKWSYQYHDVKEEYITLISGEAQIWLEGEEGEVKKATMQKNKGYHVKPGQKHRFHAISDCWTCEVSTPEVGNTFRLEDDYTRQTETEAVRLEERSKVNSEF